MTDIRRMDTPESRAYWKHVEAVALHNRLTSPEWATCVRCGHTYSEHVTRYACVLKSGVDAALPPPPAPLEGK